MIFNSTLEDKLQQQASKLVDAQQFSTIAWQLIQHKNLLSSGFVSSPSAAAVNANPIYRIYSMTKPVVSLVAIQLMAENKLRLDDKVADYIPAMSSLKVLNANGQSVSLETPITIEHLLTHTAGFSYDFLPECSVASLYREAELSSRADRSLAQVIGMLTTMPLVSQPGTQWRYSVATDVLAHVLENVTGKALPDLLAESVFEPLGMSDTAFYVPADKLERLMPVYGARDLGHVMINSDAPNELHPIDVSASCPADAGSGFYRGGHGLFSTLADYQKFMGVLQTGLSLDGQRMVGANEFELMWSDRLAPSLKPMVLGFNVLGGYGWNLMGRVMQDPAQCEFRTVAGEGGWSGAASTYFWIDRANDLSGIVMTQYIGSTVHLGPLMQHAAYGMFSD